MVQLFKDCGVEATEGFLDHVKHKKIEIAHDEEGGKGEDAPPSAASPAAGNLNSGDQRAPRSRLQSVTPLGALGIQSLLSQPGITSGHQRITGSGSRTSPSPSSLPSGTTPSSGHVAAASVPLSVSSSISPLLQSSAKQKGSSKLRVWGQHVVPGSKSDISATERINSVKIKRRGRRRVREVSGEDNVSAANSFPAQEGATAAAGGRVPDFYLDVDMPNGGKAKLAVRMDARPRELAEVFVRTHPELRQRMVPILSDKINERMERFREEKRRKRFARLHRRRRDMLARWKTPTAVGEKKSSKDEQKMDRAAQKTSSFKRDEKQRHRPQQQQVHDSGAPAAARARGPIVAKLHVQIAADSKRTINIREGDRAEDLATKFSLKYGLKPRDKDIVSKRLEQEIRQLDGRRGQETRKARYGSVSGRTSRGSPKQILKGVDIPDNLTPAQRDLLIQTMGGGAALPTPWKEAPPTASTARVRASAPIRAPTEERTPILRMKITLPLGGTDRLVVSEGDDLNALARNFVAKHSLSSESVASLHKLLRSELARKEQKNQKKMRRK